MSYPPTVTVPSLTRICVIMPAIGKRYLAVLGVHHFDNFSVEVMRMRPVNSIEPMSLLGSVSSEET
jgi:hypothetical protein